MFNYSTLIELLEDRAAKQPDQIAYNFLTDLETNPHYITYQQLAQQARAIAAELERIVKPGDRALVIYPYHQGLEFITAFFGCLYAGVIAVTDNPPRNRKSLDQLQQRIISSEATVILTSTTLLNYLKNQLSENPGLANQLNILPWIATDEISISATSEYKLPEINSNTLAFLQYTSGSTGIPKGVKVSHQNILHNSQIIYQCFEHNQNSRGLIWLPLFHDMGLIGGVIQPLYGGFPVTLMSPISLVQKPFQWLEAISKFQVTTSGGPNFAYDLLCHKATDELLANLDLSSWEVAFSGAEPVRAETIDHFVKTFGKCGFKREAFYPCYGMAETTLFMSGGKKKDPPLVKYLSGKALAERKVILVSKDQPDAKSVVSCGNGWLGDQIIIVDPDTLKQCNSDQIGEIWVAGKGVGQGYWNQPEETERTFRARLDTGEGNFLRTGDLGFIQDGELFITGRIKELIILWGRNHYPQHIEKTVEKSHPALRVNCGAAFSVEVEGEERLVVAHEIERSYLKKLDSDEVINAIRSAIVQEYLSDVYAVILLKTGTIPKTSSGKIQRGICRTMFLENSLDIVGEWRQLELESSNISEVLSNSDALV